MKLFKAFLLSFLILAGCNNQPQPVKPPTTIQLIVNNTDYLGCERQPYLAWCAPTLHPTLHDKLVKWDTKARDKFNYVDDKTQFKVTDDWRSHAAEVLSGQPWADDCDGLGETVADLLIRDGYPPEFIYRIMLSTEPDHPKVVDHFIVIVFDGYDWWVVGDTFGPMYKYKDVNKDYNILYVAKVTDGIYWTPINTPWVPKV